MKKSMKLGGGGRFEKLKGELAHKAGVSSPGGLAAYIGRKKLGAHKMEKLSAAGAARKALKGM
jgi:hypothetical protein